MSASLFWVSTGLILYVWAGYPLLVALLARLRAPAPPPEAMDLPAVTLIVSAYEEEAAIESKLANCLDLDYPADRLQILVATEPSGDRTVEIVLSWAARGIETSVGKERRGKAAALNSAIEQARGEVVAFTDANNLWEKEALKRLVAPLHDRAVGGVVGSKRILAEDGQIANGSDLYWRYESFIRRHESRLSSCIGAVGEIFALRRELYQQIPAGTVSDDLFLALGLLSGGYRVAYVEEARSWESASRSAADEAERRSRIVAGRLRQLGALGALLRGGRVVEAWQLLSHKILRLFVPIAMATALVSNVAAVLGPPTTAAEPSLLALSPPYGAVLLGLQALFYAGALIGLRLPTLSGPGRILGLATFLLAANLATAKGLALGLRGKQAPRWKKAQR